LKFEFLDGGGGIRGNGLPHGDGIGGVGPGGNQFLKRAIATQGCFGELERVEGMG
jgi:hypothetical protein